MNQPNPKPRHLLSVADVAEQLQVSPTMVRTLISERRLAAIQIGRLWRVRPEAVKGYLDTFGRQAIRRDRKAA